MSREAEDKEQTNSVGQTDTGQPFDTSRTSIQSLTQQTNPKIPNDQLNAKHIRKLKIIATKHP